jgi:CHAT domain-containing protein/Tfp pilus assembly protein PilF
MRTHAKESFLLRSLIAFLAGICLWPVAVEGEAGIPAQSAPQDVPILKLNQPLTGKLKGGESHTYKLHLEARMFARVVVTRQGVDVFMRAFDDQKKRLTQAGDNFGRVGPLVLGFVAETAGDYFVEINARPIEIGGTYEVECVESRAATNTDRTRIVAANHIGEGNRLWAEANAQSQRAALAQYDRARTVYTQINDKAGQAMALQRIGRVYEARSDYKGAMENYSSALALWREVKNRQGEAYTTNGIGGMHFYLGNLDLALPYFEQAGEISRELGNKEGEGLSYNEIANVYRQKGDIAGALKYYQKALDLYREVGTTNLMGYLLSNMGVAYRDLGDMKRAADYQNQALAIWRELNLRHGIAVAFINLGDIHEQLGETRRALSFYQQALPLCLDVGDQNCLGRTYRRLASVYDSLGETQTALDNYAKCATVYRQTERPVELVRMLNSEGVLYSLLGDKKRALVLQSEALAVSRKAQSRQDEAASLSNLAELFEDEGDAKKARDYYQQALTINREIKNRLGEAANLNRLGLLAHSGGDSREAIKLFEQALAMNAEIGARFNGALALNNLGVVHDRSGEAKVALDHFTKALAVFRQIENKSGEAMMLYRVAVVQKKLGQTEEARRNITAALEIVETIRGKIASTDLRSSYFSTVQEYYDLYIELLMREHQGRPNANLNFTALQVSEQARARSLLDLLQEAKADVRQSVDRTLLVREKELLELINGKAAQQTLAFSDPKKAELAKSLGDEIVRLSDEYETLQMRIRRSNPRYTDLAQAAPLTLPGLQKSLDPQTLLLEYKLGNERSYLWLVSQAGLESFELPPRAEIEGLCRQFYDSLTERNRLVKGETAAQKQTRIQTADRKLQTVSEHLNQMLLGPVAKSAGDKRLVIVADGALQYVPFAVLVRAGSNAVNASTANEIISLPSISVLSQLRRDHVAGQSPATVPTKAVAVFADPVFEPDDPRLPLASRKKVTRESSSALAQSQSNFDFGPNGQGLPRLFASREEAKAILALAPSGSSYGALDFEANRERAIGPELRQYRVVHFATHGLLNTSRPQLSGVVLSLYDEKGKERDGFLRLNQIYNLRLSSELVVLSACSTALGKEVKGEGLIGLTRGFMYAGAPRVIASLWKVDDEATGELMKLFYRNLFQRQMTAARALRTAQLEMQQQERWRSPYYWGAFVLQGEWR